jgi:hypothetical protein
MLVLTMRMSRFGSEAEQQHALSSMTGELGLGSKPIKVARHFFPGISAFIKIIAFWLA